MLVINYLDSKMKDVEYENNPPNNCGIIFRILEEAFATTSGGDATLSTEEDMNNGASENGKDTGCMTTLQPGDFLSLSKVQHVCLFIVCNSYNQHPTEMEHAAVHGQCITKADFVWKLCFGKCICTTGNCPSARVSALDGRGTERK